MPDTPAGKTRSLEIYRKHLEGDSVSEWELELRHKGGRPLWVHVWMEPGRGEDGSIQASRAFLVDITDRVLAEMERTRLQEQNRYLQEEIKSGYDFEQIIGRSPALEEVLAAVRQVGPTDASVLITGETGTGKELIARAIHSASKRRDKPLIKVNCAAFPAGLAESELFGHEKGAFTGAVNRRSGRFELANGGTIFLDEIGEVPLETQVKLLRVLQEREFDRVGGGSSIKVDIRVLAATNRDLLQAVREKAFREDLCYRLNVFPHRPATPASTEGRHPAAGPVLGPEVRDPARQVRRQSAGANDAAADGLSLAGEHPRTGERSRTRRHPRRGRHA
jgi:formate hydrogenlyase transcriptional activator